MFNLFILKGLEGFLDLENDNPDLYWKIREFINLQLKKFSNKWILENEDEEFDNQDLQYLLNGMFFFGEVGVTKYNEKLLPVIINHRDIDLKGNLISGKGIPALSLMEKINDWSKMKNATTLELTEEDTVYLNYSSMFQTPFLEAYRLAVAYGTAWMVYEKNLLLSQRSLMLEENGTNHENGILAKFRKFKLSMSGKDNQDATNPIDLNIRAALPVNNILSNKIGIFQLGTENLAHIKNAIDNIKGEYDELVGNKTNINFKKERQITGELDLLDIYFETLERVVAIKLNRFITKINKMTNKDYLIVKIEDKYRVDNPIEESQEEDTIVSEEVENEV